MKESKTYPKEDVERRASLAKECAEYFKIKDAFEGCELSKIAAPVSELVASKEDGERLSDRSEIENAIPWNERSLKTFGVVYRFEAIASFIGVDGKTYAVPNDKPILDHLVACGYAIADDCKGFDGAQHDEDTLVKVIKHDFALDEKIDKNLPAGLVQKIEEAEGERDYFKNNQSYAELVRFGGTFAAQTAFDEEILAFSENERKICNILTYGRVRQGGSLSDYIKMACDQTYLNEERFQAVFGGVEPGMS